MKKHLIGILGFLKCTTGVLNRIAFWWSALYAFSFTLLLVIAVFFRLADHAISWSTELARWLLISMTFIGSYSALYNGSHVGVTAILRLFPRPAKRIIVLVSNLLVLIFLVFVFIYGLKAAVGAASQYGAVLEFSMLYVKLNLPIGAGMMIVYVLYTVLGLLIYEDPEQFLLSRT